MTGKTKTTVTKATGKTAATGKKAAKIRSALLRAGKVKGQVSKLEAKDTSKGVSYLTKKAVAKKTVVPVVREAGEAAMAAA